MEIIIIKGDLVSKSKNLNVKILRKMFLKKNENNDLVKKKKDLRKYKEECISFFGF